MNGSCVEENMDDATHKISSRKRHFDYLENPKKTLTTAPQYSHGKPAAVKYDDFSELIILHDRISSSRQASLQADKQLFKPWADSRHQSVCPMLLQFFQVQHPKQDGKSRVYSNIGRSPSRFTHRIVNL